MAYDTSTFDPKAAAEARKAEMEEITSKLEKGVKDIFDGANYQQYLNFCAKLPRYSVNNQILIMMQKPDATMCQSFTNWKEVNRHVCKGEKGIRILAPAPYKMQKEQEKVDASGKTVLDKDGEPVKETVEVTINAFKPVSTFDVSQTEGEPIPTPGVDELTGSVEGYETLLAAIKDVVPVPISFEQIDSGAKGFYHLEENRIVVQEGMSEAQTVKTLLHEASHQALHSKEAMDSAGEKKSKNQKETEAESVAYVVCQHYGIDTSDYSFPYVATWSADKDEKVQTLTTVKEMDQFMEAHGEELPFDNPEADRPVGYIKIEPPVDFGKDEPERPIKLSVEKADKEPEKKAEKKKTSVKEKLKAEKAKSAKTKSPKKTAEKDMREAI